MDSTMLQLRSFVHQRLYAAAEDILGQVEKTITALYEAEVGPSKEEVGSLRHQLNLLRNEPVAEEPSLPRSSVKHGPATLQESDASLSTEVPGPSQAGTDMDKTHWNSCSTEMDFRVSKIKEEEEEEELADCSQTQTACPLETVKSEEESQVPRDEMQPLSSDQSEDSADDEELVNSKGEQINVMAEKGTLLQKQNDSVDKNEKGRSFCHVCGKGFQYIGSLMKHIKTHENTTDCHVCGMALQSTQELINHLKDCHSKTNICDICGKTFATKRSLQLHIKIHRGIKEFRCQECGKTFSRREHLVVHVRTHSGEKPYHCDICGKAFSQSQNLTIHKRAHSGEKPYHCSLCGKLFNTTSHLKTHMRFHSGEKPYPCDICGKQFRQSGQMTRHRTTHTGERPYGCHVCGMRYRFAPNLKVHMQTH